MLELNEEDAVNAFHSHPRVDARFFFPVDTDGG